MSKRWMKKNHVEPADLNLTPMMDLFVALIPFLLLSAAFVRIGGIHVNMPANQTTASAQQQKPEKIVSLTFELSENAIKIQGFSDQYTSLIPGLDVSIPVANSREGMKALTDYLSGLRAKHEKFGSALFHASPKVSYELSIRTLDIIHSVKGVASETILAAGVVE